MRVAPGSVMIFAAGLGTRMGALTADRPKPMIEVAGKPLVDHALDLARAFGPDRIVMNLHYKPEVLRRHLAGRDIRFSHEAPDLLDTGGGLRHALPLLGTGPVFTMNSDAVWAGPNPLAHLAAAWMPDKMDALLLCIDRARATGHTGNGDFTIAADGRARRGPGAVYTGLQIVKTDALADFPETAFSLNLLWNRMLDENRLFALSYPGAWCDVGTQTGIGLAEDMLHSPDV